MPTSFHFGSNVTFIPKVNNFDFSTFCFSHMILACIEPTFDKKVSKNSSFKTLQPKLTLKSTTKTNVFLLSPLRRRNLAKVCLYPEI